MEFKTLFSILIEHEYFADKKGKDICIEPTQECKEMLRRYGLLVNTFQNGELKVVSKHYGTSIVNENRSKVPFTFFIYLHDPFFEQYTILPVKQLDEVFHFVNTDHSDDVEEALIPSVIKSPVQARQGRKLLGVITITVTNSFPKRFVLKFKAAGIEWKYYLLVNTNTGNLQIEGLESGIQFQHIEELDDKIAEAITSSLPGRSVLLYKSKSPVPYIENDRKNIRLINADNNTVLLSHLPIPSLKDNGIKIVNTTI